MEIAKGIDALKIEFGAIGGEGIFPVLLREGNDITLVDTGVSDEKCTEALEKSLLEAGIRFEDISRIIITHHDHDHLGGVPAIRAKNPGVKVIAHAAEMAFIEGEKTLNKNTEEKLEKIDIPEHIKQAIKNSSKIKSAPVKVNETLKEGDVIPMLGGITVIHLPGHTPGHIGLYLNKYRILIPGDALTAKNGVLSGPVLVFTADIDMAYESLKKLSEYDIEKVICFHGGLVEAGNACIKELVEIFEAKKAI